MTEEQTSLVDVYMGGRLLTNAQATFTPDTIQFHDPQNLVSKIPALLDPQAVTAVFSKKIPANQEMRCFHKRQQNCGVLYPDVAGVIFDSDKYRATVFVNPSLLGINQVSDNIFLPPSDSGLSFLQTANYAFSGSEDEFNEDSNLFTESLLSYRENALRMTANYDDDDNFAINTLVGQRDWRGIRYLGGYFDTINQDLRFTTETPLLGLRVGTSIDTRDDQRQSSGSTIRVFLQSRGEVSIFKDGRLIATQTYDAGNQELDTTALPGGAYDIDIRIRDAAGERVETQFYSKNFRLPPEGAPQYFVEMGRLTTTDNMDPLPEKTDEYLLRGSINTRLNDTNALITGLSTTEDDSVAELGWFGIGAYRGVYYDVLLNSALARDHRYGLSTEARFNYRSVFLNATHRQIWDDSDSFNESDDDKVNLMGEEQAQTILNLSVPIDSANLGLGARYIQREDEDAITEYTANLSMEILRYQRSSLHATLQYNHSDMDDTLLASLNWRWGLDHWSVSIRPEYEAIDRDQSGSSDTTRLTATADWDSRNLWSSKLRAGVSAVEEEDFSSYGANADLAGNYGRARAQIEHVNNDDEASSVTRHNGSIASSFTIAEGAVAMGGKEQNQAAVIIDLSDAGDGLVFDVLVNNARYGTAVGGGKTLISLRPFETYTIGLKSRSEAFVYLDDKQHTITLYPGNVMTLGWQANRVNIIFARLLDQNGNAISNALLKGVSGLATTDGYGLFQAEVEDNVRSIIVETRTHTCQLNLPAYTARKGVASLGILRCELQAKPQ